MGGRFQGLILGSGSAKQTWITGEQQAHIHIHHKTSTILYIDIWTSSPGRKLRVKGVKDSSICTKRRPGQQKPWLREEGMEGIREGDKGYEEHPFDDYGGTCLVGEGGGRRL